MSRPSKCFRPSSLVRIWAPLLLVGACAGAALGAASPAFAAADDPVAQAAQLARENDLLRKRAELATADKFYLLLDPEGPSLRLMFRGAVLKEFPIKSVRVGYPALLFLRRTPGDEWQGRIFEGGTLEPARSSEREVIIAPPVRRDGSEAEEDDSEVKIPPTPEEKYPVPPRYLIRFGGGIAFEVKVRDEEAGGFFTRLGHTFSHWWEDARQALSPSPADAVRLRLEMDPAQAQSLYRALPPDVRLFVLPRP